MTRPDISALLDAARATHIPTDTRGLWTIARIPNIGAPQAPFRQIDVPQMGRYDSLTMLFRTTMATLHHPVGECVMEDSEQELRRHLPAMLAAHGRVLVTGLGLGCVVRGMLANGRVTHVDVIERDRDVIDLVAGSFDDEPRVTLHIGDARTHRWASDTLRWDFAWHDVWDEHVALDVLHGRLLAQYDALTAEQGAWQFPRAVKRCWPRPLAGASRRQQRDARHD